ncbi:MAG TPA: histidine kinase dimerization/phospho-acceptor domain-containing protein, partial [Anaeromyxobacteraceae bacterium]
VAFLAVDLGIYGPHNASVLCGRALVSAGLLASDVALCRIEDPRRLRWMLVAGMLAVVAGFAVLATGSGGAASPYLAFLGFVPIVLTVVVPDEPAVTLVAGTAGTVVGVGLGIAAGQSMARLGFALAAFGSCTFYGTISALLHRRMRQREHAAASARAEAITELARSERQRLESERLAAVGRLAAGFSHEVNNPLASASANLRFVMGRLGSAGLDPELSEALRDSREALERIRRVMADLRALASAGTGEIVDTDVASAVERAFQLATSRLGPLDEAECRVPNDLPRVWACPEHLVQVLCLLIGATGDRAGTSGPGRAADAQPARVAISAAVTDGGVLVVVHAGATTPEVLPGTIPTPVHAHRERAELSIALSRELVERWGGRIDAAVTPDGTPRFALTLKNALPASA